MTTRQGFYNELTTFMTLRKQTITEGFHNLKNEIREITERERERHLRDKKKSNALTFIKFQKNWDLKKWQRINI